MSVGGGVRAARSYPSKVYSSLAAVPHHCGRCLLVVCSAVQALVCSHRGGSPPHRWGASLHTMPRGPLTVAPSMSFLPSSPRSFDLSSSKDSDVPLPLDPPKTVGLPRHSTHRSLPFRGLGSRRFPRPLHPLERGRAPRGDSSAPNRLHQAARFDRVVTLRPLPLIPEGLRVPVDFEAFLHQRVRGVM
jgi:hypothetical protein